LGRGGRYLGRRPTRPDTGIDQGIFEAASLPRGVKAGECVTLDE